MMIIHCQELILLKDFSWAWALMLFSSIGKSFAGCMPERLIELRKIYVILGAGGNNITQ